MTMSNAEREMTREELIDQIRTLNSKLDDYVMLVGPTELQNLKDSDFSAGEVSISEGVRPPETSNNIHRIRGMISKLQEELAIDFEWFFICLNLLKINDFQQEKELEMQRLLAAIDHVIDPPMAIIIAKHLADRINTHGKNTNPEVIVTTFE